MGAERDEVWDRETMFSQLAKRSACHPAWWSADNCSVIPTVNISIETRSEPAEQLIIIFKKYHASLFFFYCICLLVLKLWG